MNHIKQMKSRSGLFLGLVLGLVGAVGSLQGAVREYFPRPNLAGVPIGNLPHLDIADPTRPNPNGLDQNRKIPFDNVQIKGSIIKIEVALALRHPHINDLVVTLASPGGTRSAVLFRNIGYQDVPIKYNMDDLDSIQWPYSFAQRYAGGVGAPFGVWTPTYFPQSIYLISQLEEDEIDLDIKSITDPGIFDDDPNSITYHNTVPAGTYYSQEDLRVFNGLNAGNGGEGTWTITVEDNVNNGLVTDSDGDSFPADFDQFVINASLIIHMSGGYKVWVGTNGTNWTDAANWDPENGPPETDQPNSLFFPGSAANFTSTNNFPAGLRIADIIMTGGSPYTVNMVDATFFKRAYILNVDSDHVLNVGNATTQTDGLVKVNVAEGRMFLQGSINGPATVKKFGPGEMIVQGAQGYTGRTYIDAGILTMQNAGSLGAVGTGSETVIRQDGTVKVGGVGTINEILLVGGLGSDKLGALRITSNQTWNGQVQFIAPFNSFFVNPVATLTMSDFSAPSFVQHELIINGGGIFETANNGNTHELPTRTALRLNDGSGFNTNVDQPNLGNLILNNSSVTGTGVLSPVSLGQFNGNVADIQSSGTSSIANPINLTGGTRGIGVSGDTLTVTGVISGGAITKVGGGTVTIESNSGTVPFSIEQGVLAGSGTIGNLSVQKQGAVNPTGTLTAGASNFATYSGFIVDVNGDQLAANGDVNLGGIVGVGGGVLQPYEGVTGTIISSSGLVTGTFDGMPNPTPGIIYNANSVVLGAASGLLAWFDPDTYVVGEAAGSVLVTVQWSAAPGTALLRNFGGNAIRSRDLTFNDAVPISGGGNSVIYLIPIHQNFVSSGDITTTLGLVPLNGARIALNPAPPATAGPTAVLTILDDDADEDDKSETCGLGTGLTVFFLFGFGLMLHMRLRRR